MVLTTRLVLGATLSMTASCSAFLTRPVGDPPRSCPQTRWLPGVDLAAAAVTGVGAVVSVRAAGAASSDPADESESRVIAYSLVGLVAAAATVSFLASGVTGYVALPRCRAR